MIPPFPAWGTPATSSWYKCKTSQAIKQSSGDQLCCWQPCGCGSFSSECKHSWFGFLLSCKAKCFRQVLPTISCGLFHTNSTLIAGFCCFTLKHLFSVRWFSNRLGWGKSLCSTVWKTLKLHPHCVSFKGNGTSLHVDIAELCLFHPVPCSYLSYLQVTAG